MGCGPSQPKKSACNQSSKQPSDAVAKLDAQIDKYMKEMRPVSRTNLDGKTYWAPFQKMAELMREKARLTGCGLDGLPEMVKHLLANPRDDEVLSWGLRFMAEVQQEMFENSHQQKDIDDAVLFWTMWAEQSGDADPDTAILVAKALLDSYKDSDFDNLINAQYILTDVYPKIAGAKVATGAMIVLSFLWRLAYTQNGDVVTLFSCIAAATAATMVAKLEVAEQETLDESVIALVEVLQLGFFYPHKFTNDPLPSLPKLPPKIEPRKNAAEVPLGPHRNGDLLYKALEAGEIRLLKLHPGDSNSPLQAELITTSLDADISYEALSYTWDDMEVREQSTMNGVPFGITKGLHSALCRLRSKTENRTVWVDAVCIDQTNLREKSSQAALVRDIYSKAKTVAMYIGEPKDISDDPEYEKWFKFNPEDEVVDRHFAVPSDKPPVEVYDWRDIWNIADVYMNPTALQPDEWPVFGALAIIFKLARNAHLKDMPFSCAQGERPYHGYYTWRKSAIAVLAIFMQSYWNRAWILQEVAVAKECNVYYGKHIVPFKYFVDAHNNLQRHTRGDCCRHFAEEDPRSNDVFPGWLIVLSGFLHMMQPAMYQMAHAANQAGTLVAVNLRDALENRTIPREATDPRDLVFSTSGLLLNQQKEPIKIDYSLSVGEVFAAAALRVYEDDGDLSALVHLDHGTDDELDIPSWTPDWRLKHKNDQRYGRRLQCWALAYTQFNASKGRTFHHRVEDDLCLAVRAVSAGRVSAIGSKWDPEFKEGERNWQSPGQRIQPPESILAQIADWRRLAGLPEHFSGSLGDLERRFWRTVFADTVYERHGGAPLSRRRMKNKDFQHIRAFLDVLQRGEVPKDYLALFPVGGPNVGSFLQTTVSRRFFVTERGQMGLGLASSGVDVAVGDEVLIVEGSNLPIVGGRVQNEHGATNSERECRHVQAAVYHCKGFGYLEGVMDGEAVGRQPLPEVFLR